MESDVILGMPTHTHSIRRQLQIYFAYVSSNLPLQKKLYGHISETWFLFWNHFAAVWFAPLMEGVILPLMKLCNKKRRPKSPISQRYQTTGYASAHSPKPLVASTSPQEIPLCLTLFKRCSWNAAMSQCSWKRTISVSFLPALGNHIPFGTCMSIFWDDFWSLEEDQCNKIDFSHWLRKLDLHTIWPNECGSIMTDQSRVCRWRKAGSDGTASLDGSESVD